MFKPMLRLVACAAIFLTYSGAAMADKCQSNADRCNSKTANQVCGGQYWDPDGDGNHTCKSNSTVKAASVQVAPRRAVMAQTARNKVYESQRLSAGEGGTDYKCNHPGGGTYSCECKGIIDCKNMISSGKCKGQPIWEDGNDPAIGGCDAVPED